MMSDEWMTGRSNGKQQVLGEVSASDPTFIINLDDRKYLCDSNQVSTSDLNECVDANDMDYIPIWDSVNAKNGDNGHGKTF